MIGVLALGAALAVYSGWPRRDAAPPAAAGVAPQPAGLPPAVLAVRAAGAAGAAGGPTRRALAADADVHGQAEAEAPPEIAAPTPDQRRRFRALIVDLAHDDLAGNAMRAMHGLQQPDAVPLLHEALASRDLQQRHLCAVVLARMGVPTSARLGEVLVEAMHGDVERELFPTLAHSSAVLATRHLHRRPANARAPLRRALWGGDAQQRFLAAFLLGCDGSIEDAPAIVRELVGHLADNHVEGDALMAAHALWRLGPRVEPLLLPWRSFADRQGRELIDLVLLDLQRPPRTPEVLRARRPLQRVTAVYDDPVVEFDIGLSRVATL